jgi:hypothetical protein
VRRATDGQWRPTDILEEMLEVAAAPEPGDTARAPPEPQAAGVPAQRREDEARAAATGSKQDGEEEDQSRVNGTLLIVDICNCTFTHTPDKSVSASCLALSVASLCKTVLSITSYHF